MLATLALVAKIFALEGGLGQVAANTGYADQAHLIRDFRQFTGIIPAGYQALALRPTRDRADR
jgi:AraC-like DNA-binding protein